MASRKRSMSNDADMHALYKEWDEASCPICMDHPHNAVLLLCSSYDKGCRSYICDTSYRHSNCLDRFKKLKAENRDTSITAQGDQDIAVEISDENLELRNSSGIAVQGNPDTPANEAVAAGAYPGGSEERGNSNRDNHMDTQEGAQQTSGAVTLWESSHEEASANNSSDAKLKCPMCRGDVFGWKVVEDVRKHLNLKPRSCSCESCSFIGSYRELRRHARRVHPTARPADIDPSRQRAWRRLQNQREYDDIVSAIRSAMPGAIVLGDYVIENGDRLSGERDRGASGNGRWLSTFFLFQMIGSTDQISERRGGRSRAYRRSTGPSSRRRYLWGENLLGLQDEYDDEDEDEHDLSMLNDMNGDLSTSRRRRRRLMRSRSDEDQQ